MTMIAPMPPISAEGTAPSHAAMTPARNSPSDPDDPVNIELTAIQTLFMREHNRLADQIARANPNLPDEAIFQQARRLVIGAWP